MEGKVEKGREVREAKRKKGECKEGLKITGGAV